MSSATIRSAYAATAILAALGLAACAESTITAEPTPAATVSSMRESNGLRIEGAWVKAADTGMSAAFGILQNTSNRAIRVTAVTSKAATSMQLHETVPSADGGMEMRQKPGGFVIPADGKVQLEPGGNHLMLMGLTKPIRPGDDVTFTLTLSDGSALDFTAPAKAFTGANENYAEGHG